MWDVFPEKCFKKRDLESTRHAARRFYHRATNGVEGDDIVDNKGKLANILRGAGRGSDKVLDWLPKESAKTCLVALSNVPTIGKPVTVESVRHSLETILRRLNASENLLQEIPGKIFQ
ncbi:MAG: hypothetical protein Q9217_003965 [Psora testacea]